YFRAHMESIFSSKFAAADKFKAPSCKTKAEPVTSGNYFKDLALGSIEFGFGKLSRAFLSRSWSFIIPTIREQ
ncbi:hypothetical protein H4S07_005947, partial [Coemansia furcata]